MGKTGTVTKATKKRKFVDLKFECDDATLKRLNKIADLAAVTLSQAVSVILATYVQDFGEVKMPTPPQIKANPLRPTVRSIKKASTGAKDWQDPSKPLGMPEEWTMGKNKKIKKRIITTGFGLGDK